MTTVIRHPCWNYRLLCYRLRQPDTAVLYYLSSSPFSIARSRRLAAQEERFQVFSWPPVRRRGGSLPQDALTLSQAGGRLHATKENHVTRWFVQFDMLLLLLLAVHPPRISNEYANYGHVI